MNAANVSGWLRPYAPDTAGTLVDDADSSKLCCTVAASCARAEGPATRVQPTPPSTAILYKCSKNLGIKPLSLQKCNSQKSVFYRILYRTPALTLRFVIDPYVNPGQY
jgi:hypothetical protein